MKEGSARKGAGPERLDGELIRRAQDGDAEAFEVIVRRLQGQAYGLAFRILFDAASAEDAVQEAFLRLHRSLATLDPERPVRTWFLTVTANLCRDRLRQRKRRPEEPLDRRPPDEESAAKEPAAPLEVDRVEVGALRELLDRLTETQRRILALRFGAGFSYEEIAEAMGLSRNSIGALLFRAREDLRVLWKRAYGNEER